MKSLNIRLIKDFNSAYVLRINQLLSQLTSSPINFTEDDLKALIASPNSQLFFIYVEEEIAGMLTVGSYLAPTGKKYWIEDVVVDQCYRGKSLGKKMVEEAIAYIQKQQRGTIMLTSNPKRIAANKLYQAVGFEQKITNVYKIKF